MEIVADVCFIRTTDAENELEHEILIEMKYWGDVEHSPGFKCFK